MNIEKLIPILLEQQRSFVAQSRGEKTKAVQVKRPSWADMIKNYPDSSIDVTSLYKTIGNGLLGMYQKDKAWANTCAFRMSKGLNYSGFKLPYNNTKYRAAKGGVHIGDDKLNYWYRVRELAPYLADHLGTPEVDIKLNPIEMPNNLKKKERLTDEEAKKLRASKSTISKADWAKIRSTKGIITFDVSGWNDASGHFTLWDKQHLIYPGEPEHDDPNNAKYYFHMLLLSRKKNGDLGLIQTNRIRIWELK